MAKQKRPAARNARKNKPPKETQTAITVVWSFPPPPPGVGGLRVLEGGENGVRGLGGVGKLIGGGAMGG